MSHVNWFVRSAWNYVKQIKSTQWKTIVMVQENLVGWLKKRVPINAIDIKLGGKRWGCFRFCFHYISLKLSRFLRLQCLYCWKAWCGYAPFKFSLKHTHAKLKSSSVQVFYTISYLTGQYYEILRNTLCWNFIKYYMIKNFQLSSGSLTGNV